MSFYAAGNTVTRSVVPCDPWEFKITEKITLQIRKDKESRQEWYQNVNTHHNFYTGIEAHNKGQRVSKENPPRAIHGLVADYDIAIPAERIVEVVASMDIKPAWIEESLGGNFRLVWSFENPVITETEDFCTYFLQQAHDWLRLDLLPGLDRKAFEECSRLYCNGGVWKSTGAGSIPGMKLQAFFVACGKKFRFKAGDDEAVPLDLVEKGLQQKYSGFNWPSSFELESQGPTFWIPESVSPLSAIVKAGGIFTFAAHAAKPFYTWTDLLGKEFTAKYQSEAIARATEDIWWDSRNFHRKKDGAYKPLDKSELMIYFKADCRLSFKPTQSGLSQVDLALAHIYSHQHVDGAAPYVFHKPGLIHVKKERKLNTYNCEPIPPAAGKQTWGPQGSFPFISAWLDSFFNPAAQLPHSLAGLKHFYTSAVNWDPQPGWNFILMGGAGVGKTLYNREVWGALVGGYADASEHIVYGGTFNSELLAVPHWCIDDDAPANTVEAQVRVQAMFKKVAANQQFMRNAKYEKGTMVDWAGRLGCTTNLDFVSSRIVGPLDNTSLDKMSLFRCHVTSQIKFPPRNELIKLLRLELPFFARWLLDWVPPDFVKRDTRYGYQAHQESALMDQTRQTSSAASFKEVMIEFLYQWFQDNEEQKYWEGTVSSLLRSVISVQANELIMKTMKLEQTSRYLEQIQREGSFKIEVHQGAHNVRLWRVYRHDAAN